MNRLLLFVSTLLLTAVSITAAKPSYESYAAKAERFFANSEWASAAAMYQVMIDMRPDIKSNYSRAIVAEGMRDGRDAQMAFFNGALQQGIPFDSLLTQVRRVSFQCGATDLYEHFLYNVRDTHQWMGRVVDGYLLDYYSFRCNGPQIVAYSRKMLEGLPDDPRYLLMLARGYLLQGNMTQAGEVYRQVLDINPDNFDALLYLGNYYLDTDPASPQGVDFLRRAYAVRPTPYVEKRLAALRN